MADPKPQMPAVQGAQIRQALAGAISAGVPEDVLREFLDATIPQLLAGEASRVVQQTARKLGVSRGELERIAKFNDGRVSAELVQKYAAQRARTTRNRPKPAPAPRPAPTRQSDPLPSGSRRRGYTIGPAVPVFEED